MAGGQRAGMRRRRTCQLERAALGAGVKGWASGTEIIQVIFGWTVSKRQICIAPVSNIHENKKSDTRRIRIWYGIRGPSHVSVFCSLNLYNIVGFKQALRLMYPLGRHWWETSYLNGKA